jgi:hypothetical protein
MYDFVSDTRSRLGLFVNFYILRVATGFSSNAEPVNESFRVTASLSNFGAQAYCKINKWFGVSVMFDYLYLESYLGLGFRI